MINKTYYVYIVASKKNGTLYIGITSNLERRMFEHKTKFTKGFTKKYDVALLVHFEEYDNPHDAIHREKTLKKWKRKWKINLIEDSNPRWKDLAQDWF